MARTRARFSVDVLLLWVAAMLLAGGATVFLSQRGAEAAPDEGQDERRAQGRDATKAQSPSRAEAPAVASEDSAQIVEEVDEADFIDVDVLEGMLGLTPLPLEEAAAPTAHVDEAE